MPRDATRCAFHLRHSSTCATSLNEVQSPPQVSFSALAQVPRSDQNLGFFGNFQPYHRSMMSAALPIRCLLFMVSE